MIHCLIEKMYIYLANLSIVYNFSSVTSKHFNSISTDRSSSLLVTPEKSLEPFDINDENAYLQSGSGVYPRLDLTPFRQFLEDEKSKEICCTSPRA